MIWRLAAWGALLLGTGVHAGGEPPIGPIETVEVRDGPRVLLRHRTDPGLVAIRVSVPISDPVDAGLAPQVHVELVRRRLETGAERIGAAVAAAATPTHVVYTVAGPAADFSELAWLLRGALAEPTPSPRELRAAQLSALQRETAELEAPAWRVRRDLRRALFPTTAGPDGVGSADAVGARELLAFWRRTVRPERTTAVVVGPVRRDALEEAFRSWPRPARDGGASAPVAPARVVPDPEVNLPWAGLGYPGGGADPASLAVAARLVSARLADGGLRAADAELWWAEGRHALILIGSIYGARTAEPLVGRLREAVAATAEDVEAMQIAAPRRELRNALLFQARTTAGLAELIGDFHDRTGRPDGAVRFLEALDRVTASSVRESLEAILAGSPVTVEITP